MTEKAIIIKILVVFCFSCLQYLLYRTKPKDSLGHDRLFLFILGSFITLIFLLVYVSGCYKHF